MTIARTDKLSKPALRRLDGDQQGTGLNLSAVVERLILGLPIGTQ